MENRGPVGTVAPGAKPRQESVRIHLAPEGGRARHRGETLIRVLRATHCANRIPSGANPSSSAPIEATYTKDSLFAIYDYTGQRLPPFITQMPRDLYAARKVLGNNVRRLRQAKELTQGQLAARVGARLSWISEVETAQTNSTLDNIQRLAWALGVLVSDLLKED